MDDSFSCYGIDPYNLYNKNKIDNLHELAKYYLLYIDEIMSTTCQEIYHLFGWSLGGQIALEMACILEKKGITKIKVYALDTSLPDKNSPMLDNYIEQEKMNEKKLRQRLILEGYDRHYIEKLISNVDIENKIRGQILSSQILLHTQVILFKAMLDYEEISAQNMSTYQILSKIVTNIKLIKVYKAHHLNILDQEDLLVKVLKERDREGVNLMKLPTLLEG